MAVIFADINGVFNSADDFELKETQMAPSLNPDSVRRFNRAIVNTGAKVVISSDCRFCFSLQTIIEAFKHAGFEGEIIDTTPKVRTTRGQEIAQWLDRNADITKFVVLDDICVTAIDPFQDRFVQTTFFEDGGEGGLQDYHVEEIIALLS